MTVTLLKRLATLAALVCLAATLNTSAVGAQESRPGSDAALAGDQTPEQQIERLYGAVFDRDPDAGGFAFWVDQLTSGDRNLQQIADAMVGASPEFTETYGDLDDDDFVNQLYLNVQERNGDAEGITFWTGQLTTGELTRGGVVLGFSESTEYRVATGSTDPLDRLYCAFFLRNPDSSGKTFWTDQYLVEERSLDSIAQSFAGVAEFTDLYGTLSNREFVELIYQNVLGRDLPLTETGGPDFWTNELDTDARTRGQVMLNFSEATEYQNRWTRNAPCPPAGADAPVTSTTPVAVDDAITSAFVGATTVNWDDNDTVPTGTTVTVTQGTNGAVVDNEDGTFTYTRNANDATSDTFTYTLTNGDETSTATVTVTIAPSTAPVAVDDAITSDFVGATVVNWDDNDTVPTGTTVTVTQGTNGAVVDNEDGTFTYTRNANDATSDTFTYTLTNGDETSTATVTVTITPAGSDASAVADRMIVRRNTVAEPTVDFGLNVLDNDTATGRTITSITQPSNGTAVIDGTLIDYTPTVDYELADGGFPLVYDTFTYTLTETATGATSTATVTVAVLEEPECEVFMNYPFDDDVENLQLFFSSEACFEIYQKTGDPVDVNWTNVTIDGDPATLVAPANAMDVLQEFVTVPTSASADGEVILAGTATLTVDGVDEVVIDFGLTFTNNAGNWERTGFSGRDDDVTILNPGTTCITSQTCN